MAILETKSEAKSPHRTSTLHSSAGGSVVDGEAIVDDGTVPGSGRRPAGMAPLGWSGSRAAGSPTILGEIRRSLRHDLDAAVRSPVWPVMAVLQPVLWLLLLAPLLGDRRGVSHLAGGALTAVTTGTLVLLALYGWLLVGFALLAGAGDREPEHGGADPAGHALLVSGRVLRDLLIFIVQAGLLLGVARLVGIGASGADLLMAAGLVVWIGLPLAVCSYTLASMLAIDARFAATLNLVVLPFLLFCGAMLPAYATAWIQGTSVADLVSFAADVVQGLLG
jgi:ABC-2 type transport system permease protein